MNAFDSDWQTAPLKPPRDAQCEYVKLWIIQRITSTVSTCNDILPEKRNARKTATVSACFVLMTFAIILNDCWAIIVKNLHGNYDYLLSISCNAVVVDRLNTRRPIFLEVINRFSHSIFMCAHSFAYNSLRSNLIKTHRVSLICCNLTTCNVCTKYKHRAKNSFIECERVKLQYDFA